mmetsp:Transcript_118456/g.281217  ORF Transcript_118456/g.281217 Transcript_118456/m.281217 type:complete len:206 (+) Transcript_118456:594-1211(+)
MLMSRFVHLVIVARPAANAHTAVLLDALVAHALLDAHKIRVILDLYHHAGLDVLPRSPRHIVDEGWSELERRFQMHDNPGVRRLAVVRIDQKRGIHPSSEALLRGPDGLCSVVAASISDNEDSASEFGLRVRDEAQVFVPGKEMTLPCRAANNQAFDSIGDLVLHNLFVSLEIHLSIRKIRRLHSCDEPHLSQSKGRLGHGSADS